MEHVRSIPHSQDAERAVLGGMLAQDTALALVIDRLNSEDYFIPAHKTIFDAVIKLYSTGAPVDEVTLVSMLESTGKLAQAGGITYVTDLRTALPTLANLEYYISIVLEHSTLRKLLAASEQISKTALESTGDVAKALSMAEKAVFDISSKRMPGGLVHIEPYISAGYFELTKRIGQQTGVTGLPTGFDHLDNMLSGLQRSDLVIVAARPAMGKTSFAMNIAQHAAVKADAVVAVFELEMSRQQLSMRMFCTQARVDMQRVKSGQLTDDDWDKLFMAVDPLAKSKLYIDDTPGATVAGIRSKLKRLKIETGHVDLVVIDYLQLLSVDGKSESRQLEVSEMTRALKILARDLDTPIMLLSQLSRAPEQRADHRPVMSDLRESGAIEQDADIIMMLYREKAYDEEADDVSEVIINKHRNGPTGVVKLYWRGEYTCFENIADENY